MVSHDKNKITTIGLIKLSNALTNFFLLKIKYVCI